MKKGSKKIHGKATQKYLAYLCEVIDSHNLSPPFQDCNVKDYFILSKYFNGKSEASLTKSFNDVKNKLLALQIIKNAKVLYYKIGEIPYMYSINTTKLLEYLDYYQMKYPRQLGFSKDINIYFDNDNFENFYHPPNSKQLVTQVDKKTYKKIRFGTMRVRFHITDEEVKAVLYDKYPQLDVFQKECAVLNALYHCNDEYKFDSFQIHIHRSKTRMITKIGIRCFNKFALLPSIEKEITINGKKVSGVYHDYVGSRQEFLDKHFGKGNWEEYDVKGSVPTICRMMNKGIIKDLSTDTYEECYSHIFTEWDINIRKLVKSYSMRMIFGGSIKNIVAKITGTKIEKAPKEYVDFITKMKQAEEEYCGNPNGDTSVFLHESCIYMMVKAKLEQLGYDVYQCYDGFYYAKGKIKDIEKIIYNCMEKYMSMYQNK